MARVAKFASLLAGNISALVVLEFGNASSQREAIITLLVALSFLSVGILAARRRVSSSHYFAIYFMGLGSMSALVCFIALVEQRWPVWCWNILAVAAISLIISRWCWLRSESYDG